MSAPRMENLSEFIDGEERLADVLKQSPALAAAWLSVDCVALARRILAAGYRFVDQDEKHVIELRPDGYTIKHPLACRAGELFDCPVNRAAQAEDGPPATPGRYECEARDGELVIGEPVSVFAHDVRGTGDPA